MQPLPNRTSPTDQKHCNRGLYWAKFFDMWNEDYTDCLGEHHNSSTKEKYYNGKMSWILNQFNERKHENTDSSNRFNCKNDYSKGSFTVPNISTAARRIEELAKQLGGKAQNFISDAPFVTGTGLPHPVENGFVFHHTYGVPYLPASSIKGMICAWVLHWHCEEEEKDEAFRLFGSNDDAGSLIVFDALPSGEVNLMAEILTPHTGNWRITDSPAQHPPADWISPNPIPFLAVAPGAMFQFAFAPRKPADAADVEKAVNYLSEALDWIGAGAKTSIGMGRMVAPTAHQSAAKSSLKEDDEVIIAGGNVNVGRKGTIFKFVPVIGSESRAQLTPLEGEAKLKGTYALSDLTLVEKNPTS